MKQEEALTLMKLGHNIFLTGAAGAGKTYVLNQYIAYLREHKVKVAVTASTGIAATRLNGITIHSWAGIGVREVLTRLQIDGMQKDKRLKKRMSRAMVLIIDEISMLHSFQLDLVDQVLRQIRANEAPFGGLQVIFCGDFFQLPPVSKNGEEALFAFAAQSWAKAELKIAYLQEQHRQTDDGLLSVLNDIRRGNVGENTLTPLRACYRRNFGPEIVATRLYTHNVDVDLINQKHLDALPGEVAEYAMTSEGPELLTGALKKNCLAPETLKLKKNALVMCVRNNFEKKYVNGTLATVTDTGKNGPTIKSKGRHIDIVAEEWSFLEDSTKKASITQFPLRLAWAITIHKSQGMSLDAAEMDLSKCFVPGMGYVALSRVRQLDGLNLLGLNPMALRVDEKILHFDETLQAHSNQEVSKLHALSPSMQTKQIARFLRQII